MEFNVPFQHKHSYIRDEPSAGQENYQTIYPTLPPRKQQLTHLYHTREIKGFLYNFSHDNVFLGTIVELEEHNYGNSMAQLDYTMWQCQRQL